MTPHLARGWGCVNSLATLYAPVFILVILIYKKQNLPYRRWQHAHIFS